MLINPPVDSAEQLNMTHLQSQPEGQMRRAIECPLRPNLERYAAD
jgi:hypothetical protein